MAPARLVDHEDEDPVTAEYEIYLTPRQQGDILLLQYPNRNRERPYNDRMGAGPSAVRIKPRTGYMEADIPLNTKSNFNKYQGLKWGDALKTATELQNESSTYGLASGFTGSRASGPGGNRRTVLRDAPERELAFDNDLTDFRAAEHEGKVMAIQTLGGQITRHDSFEERGKPIYFIGAFHGSELHLTQVDGTVQMRPQFHHVDAEDQRNRVFASREHAAAAEGGVGGSGPVKNDRTLLQPTFKTNNPKGDLDQRQKSMEEFLKTASEEKWVSMEYVDEEAESAYRMFQERLFVQDTDATEQLHSSMDNDAYLDAISAQREGSPTRRRKRASRRRATDDEDDPIEVG